MLDTFCEFLSNEQRYQRRVPSKEERIPSFRCHPQKSCLCDENGVSFLCLLQDRCSTPTG